MPLLEIIRSQDTSKQVLVDTFALSSRIKKTPVLVGNCTGFAVNRVFFPYTMSASLLVDLGLDPYHIDRVISQNFGMPYGPFRLSDLVGADIGMHVGKNFMDAFSDRVYISQLFPLMNKYKRLGEKTGTGFYKFQKNRKTSLDPELEPILEESRSSANLRRPSKNLTEQDIIEFIFFPVINEACRVLSEGIVVKASDLDVASILGMGFPPHKGGIVFWADLVGAEYVFKRLLSFAEMLPDQAGFFKPSRYLEQCAKINQTLEHGPSLQSKM